MKKRTISIILALAMVIGLFSQIEMPVEATGETTVATVTTTTNVVTEYTTLMEAFEAAKLNVGSTLKLRDNVDFGNVSGGTSCLTISNANFVLDLNNFHITASTIDGGITCSVIKLSTGGTLTIKDSSIEQGGFIDFLYKGQMYTGNIWGSGIQISGGTVNLESGSIFGSNEAVIIDDANSKLNMSGGVIYGNYNFKNCEAIAIDTNGAKASTIVTISGGYLGRINKSADLIWAPYGSVSNVSWNITGGYFDSNAITAYAKLTTGYSVMKLPAGVKNACTGNNIFEYEVIFGTNKFAQVVNYTDNLVSTQGGSAFVSATDDASAKAQNVSVPVGNQAYYVATAAPTYMLDGWYNSTTFSTQNRVSVETQLSQTITTNTVLYARFIKIPLTYSISFDMQQHGVQVASQVITSGEKVTEPTKPTALGYTFGGWYKDSACNVEWKFDEDTVTAATTLYAKWKSNACDITAFSITDPNVSGIINGTNISLSVPFGTDVTALIPTIAISENASISPASGTKINITTPVTYTVTGEDGITRTSYTINVEVAQNPDIEKVAAAKSAAETASYTTMDHESALDEQLIKSAITDTATSAINNHEIEVTTNKISYTPSVAGTKENPSGKNGSYKFTITVKKGLQTQVTEQRSITIMAAPYEAIPTYSVSGTVKTAVGDSSSNTNVKLMQGKIEKGSAITTEKGVFKIKGIPNGRYNLVITKGEVTVTAVVVVDKENYTIKDAIVLPIGKQNTEVDIIEGAPSIVVGGLNELFNAGPQMTNKGLTQEDKDAILGGGSVQLKLVAEGKGKDAPNANDIVARALLNGNKVGEFIDLAVLKTVRPFAGLSSTIKLAELPSLIEVYIPLSTELQKQQNYVIYRYHDNKVESITTVENQDHEKIELIDDGTMLKLTIKKFSTYAIAYKNTTIISEIIETPKLVVALPKVIEVKNLEMIIAEKVETETETNTITDDEKVVIEQTISVIKPIQKSIKKPTPSHKQSDSKPVALIITFSLLALLLMIIALRLYLKYRKRQKN